MKCRSISTATLALAFVASLTGLASASPDSGERVLQRTVFSEAEIAANRRDDNDQQARQARDQHLEQQARNGRLVDRRQVEAAVLGAGAAVTWEKGAPVTEARLGRMDVDTADDHAEDLVELAYLSAESDRASRSSAAGGAGMGDASYSGGSKLSDYCQTWSYSGSSITGCQEKFKPTNDGSSTRDYYAYNRFATATGRELSWDTDFYPVKIDIRTRPRKGYEDRTKGLSGYFPHDSAQLCNEGSSVNLTLGSLSLGIGLTNCSDKQPQVNATYKTMGMLYDDGFYFGGPRVKGAEYEAEFWTYQNYSAPLLGDYNYAKFCKDTLSNCTGTTGLDGW